ncbi:MAG: hypothetical protein ACRDD1_18120 [Planctomycetia bacterium]
MDAGVKRAFSKYGAYVRQTAKTSMKKRKGASAPGTPPNAHKGDLRKLIFFAYDPKMKTVIVGPTLFRASGLPTVPETNEKGGVRQGDDGTAIYPMRPYMRPAAARNRPLVSDLLRNSMR